MNRPPAHGRDDDYPEDEGGSVQIGPTDHGMVRLILTTASGVFEMDFPPEEAREIADEILASAEIAEQGGKAKPRGKPRPENRNGAPGKGGRRS